MDVARVNPKQFHIYKCIKYIKFTSHNHDSGNIFGIGPLEYHGFDPFPQDCHFFRLLGPWGRQDSNLVGHCLMTCFNDGTSTLQSVSFSDASLKNPSCQKS
jgi:hypothetical protein